MTYTDTDISILAHMIIDNEVSVKRVIEWAYSQYADNGVEPWIEKVTLALDKSDLLYTLRDNFHVSEELSLEIKSGKIAHDYFHKKISLEDAIHRLLYGVFFDSEITSDKKALYLAEDFFSWHNNPEIEALKIARPILEKYIEYYEQSYRKFSV